VKLKPAIPPYVGEPEDSWIRSDQLAKIPHQDLLPAEAGPFLHYLFSAIARRPRPVNLREGASVARYLKILARQTKPGAVRMRLEHLAEVIWGTVLQFARFPVSSREEALRFLETHGMTYLAGLKIEAELEYIRNAKPPSASGVTVPPHLLSGRMSAQGQGTSQLADDLTERIWVAYRALRKANVRNARRVVAAALNEQGLETRARGATSRAWGPEEIGERVKQFETREKRRSRSSSEWEKLREAVVSKWVYLFRSHPARDAWDASGKPPRN